MSALIQALERAQARAAQTQARVEPSSLPGPKPIHGLNDELVEHLSL